MINIHLYNLLIHQLMCSFFVISMSFKHGQPYTSNTDGSAGAEPLMR